MKYPDAIVIAVAILGGAVVLSQQGRAGLASSSVALANSPAWAGIVWVAHEDGMVRFCETSEDRSDATCSEWR